MRRMFSEKQVKELVNQGIEEGSIHIPSGGTKLYKHSAKVNILTVDGDIDFGGDITLVIISKTPNSYVDISALTNDMSNFINIYCLNNQGYLILDILYMLANDVIVAVEINNFSLQHDVINTITLISDTITPLY